LLAFQQAQMIRIHLQQLELADARAAPIPSALSFARIGTRWSRSSL